MWIFTKDAFLSIAQHPEDPRLVIVHGSIEGDIERIFPGAEVGQHFDSDHRFSAAVTIDRAVQAMIKEFKSINYGELQSAVEEVSRWHTYINVWVTMYEEQTRRSGDEVRKEKAPKTFDLDAI